MTAKTAKQPSAQRPLFVDLAAAGAEATIEAAAEAGGRVARAALVAGLFVLWLVAVFAVPAVRLVHLPLVGGLAGAFLFVLNRRRRDLAAAGVGVAASIVAALTWGPLPQVSLVAFAVGSLVAAALVSFDLVEAALAR
jgi:hypothetical protein